MYFTSVTEKLLILDSSLHEIHQLYQLVHFETIHEYYEVERSIGQQIKTLPDGTKVVIRVIKKRKT